MTHVATPHGLDFAHAAALYGFGYERAADVDAFRAALDRALGGRPTDDHRRPHRPRGERRRSTAASGSPSAVRHVACRAWPTSSRR